MKVLQQNLVVSIIRKRYLTAEIIEAASSVWVLPSRIFACWGNPPNPRSAPSGRQRVVVNTLINTFHGR